MSKERIQRINHLLQEILSEIIHQEANFPPDILITIQGVETSSDFRQSKIKISIFPSERADEVLNFFKKNIQNFQKILNKKLKMKIVPKIIFQLDFTEEKAARIEKLLKNHSS